MDANAINLLDFIQGGEPFEIPIYQRAYSWETKQCQKLWEDILSVGRSADKNLSHFIGAVIYTQDEDAEGRPKRFVIDGQQRFATVMLLIEALARSLNAGETVGGLTATELRRQYLYKPDESGERAYKLLLNKQDREALKAVLSGGESQSGVSRRIQENFEHYRSLIDGLAPLDSALKSAVFDGLRKLKIAAVELNLEHENPQQIFENMNTKKRVLSKSDLIRNYVLLDMEPDDQNELYRAHWRPMEEEFHQRTYAKDFDDFIRYYLAFKNRKMPVIKRLYDEFQNFMPDRIREYSPKKRAAAMKKVLADIQKFAGYYCAMKLGKERDPRLNAVFSDIQELKANTLFPLLLGMYDDYASGGILTAAQFEEAARILESYVLRRAVCGISGGLNLSMPLLHSMIEPARYLDSVRQIFRTRATSRRFPGDVEFKRMLWYGDMLSLAPCRYLLRKLETHGAAEPLGLDNYGVECVMPQKPKNGDLSDEWKREIGPKWEDDHANFVHNLGNLTLINETGPSPHDPFPVKREAYRESPLWLNAIPGKAERWGAKAIRERARVLAERAMEVWPTP